MSAAKAASAASMPDFIAVCVPLILGTLGIRGAADQRAARKNQARDGLDPALVQGARAVADPPAALERAADRGMRLEALELLERREIGILVVETDQKPTATWLSARW